MRSQQPPERGVGQRNARHEHSLGIPGGVRRHDRETVGFQLQEVVRQKAVHHLAVAEAHAHPKAIHLRARMEDPALGLGLRRLEISNKINGFDFSVGDDEHAAGLAEHLRAFRM